MKTVSDCITWIDCIMNTYPKPNIEDMNYFNAIKYYLNKVEPNDDKPLKLVK